MTEWRTFDEEAPEVGRQVLVPTGSAVGPLRLFTVVDHGDGLALWRPCYNPRPPEPDEKWRYPPEPPEE